MQDELVEVQPKFKKELLEAVAVFQEDVAQFETAYEKVNEFSIILVCRIWVPEFYSAQLLMLDAMVAKQSSL